jgi:hypothetical protein
MILDPFITLTAKLFLGLLLLATGVHKGVDPSRLRALILSYRLVPPYSVRTMARLAVGVEVTLGAALMVPAISKPVSLPAAGVFAIYFVVVGLSLVLARDEMDCGCSFHGMSVRVSGAHLVRNAVLVVLALVASMADSGRAIGWWEEIQIGSAVLCLALIYLGTDSLLATSGNAVRLET